MAFIDKKRSVLILFFIGLLLVVFWLIGKFIAKDWLPTYYVDIFGTVGFLVLGYLGLSKANQAVGPPEKEEE